MSQPATSSRLTNSSVNINGATTATSTNFGLARIGVTGNSFDISSSSGTVTLGITGTGNVQLGNTSAGVVSFPGTTTFTTLNSPAVGTNMSVGGNLTTGVLTLGSTASTTNLYGTLDITDIEGPTGTSNLNIGRNITAGSITIGNTASNNTVTIGNNGVGPTGTVNVGLSAGTLDIGSNAGGINIGNGGSFVGDIAIGGGNNLRVGNVYVGTAGAGPVFVGNVASPLALRGSSIAFTGTTTLAKLDATAAGTGILIGDNITGGSLELANGTSFTGNIRIGAGSTTRTGTISIGTGGSGAITIGTVNSPIAIRASTLTFTSPLTLGAAPTAVATNTATTLLGQIMTTSIAAGNNSPTASLQIVNAGIYIITFQLIGSGTGVFGNYYISGGIPLSGAIVQSTGGAAPNNYYSSGTIVYSIGAGTYTLTSSFNTGSLSVSSGNFTFCRIG